MENHNFENQGTFNREMNSRYLQMLSIGGVIGTGLFLSSGYTIAQAGPFGAVAAYLFGAVMVYLVWVSFRWQCQSQVLFIPMRPSLSVLEQDLWWPGCIGFVG